MGFVSPDKIDQTRRAHAGAPDRVDHRIVGGKKRLARRDAESRAVLPGDVGRDRFELVRSHIIGGGIDEITRKENAFRDAAHFFTVDIGRQHKACDVLLGFARTRAIAIKGIGPDRPGKGRAFTGECVRHISERIDSGGQFLGEEGQGMRISPCAQP